MLDYPAHTIKIKKNNIIGTAKIPNRREYIYTVDYIEYKLINLN